MAIVLDGSNLTIESLVRTARFGEQVAFAPAARRRLTGHADMTGMVI
jgi:histidine ammonia-lyase